MTGAASTRPPTRSGTLLPRGGSSAPGWLALTATSMALVLVGAGAVGTSRAPPASPTSASQGLLIAVTGQALEPSDAAAARAAERLGGLPGVARAQAVAPADSVIQLGAGANQEPGVRWVRVDIRTPDGPSLRDLRKAVSADAVRLASPSSNAASAAQDGTWLFSWVIAAAGLFLLMAALAWDLAERAFARAAPAIEKLRGLGARETLLASLLLRRAPLACAAAGLASVAALAGGWLALHRAGVATSLGVPDAVTAFWPLMLLAALPPVLAAGLTLGALRRSARPWP